MKTSDQAIILGAGPSGLSSGMGLLLNGYPGKITVVEKAAQPGGLAGSFAWKGHMVDFGPHRLSPNIPDVRMLATELLGPDLLIEKSQHGVQIGERLYQFPPRVSDWLGPSQLLELFLFGLSFIAGSFVWVTRRFDVDSFESVICRKFGRRFYERILAPMAKKVWTDPARIDPLFAELRFAHVQPSHVIRKLLFPKQELNPSTFYYPRKGFRQLWDSMAGWISNAGHDVLYETEATAIHVEKNMIRAVEMRGPGGTRTIETDGMAVVSTIPLGIFVKLLRGIDNRALIERLSKAKVRSMILAAIELDQAQTLPFRTLIYPGAEFRFNRLFEQNRYSRDTVVAGKSVVVADITVDPGDPLLAMPDDRLVEMVRENLRRLPYIDTSRITDAKIIRVPYAYVVPDIETREAMFAAHHELKAISNLHLRGRFSVGEYDNSDFAIDHGLQLGAMLTGRISALEYMRARHELSNRNIVG